MNEQQLPISDPPDARRANEVSLQEKEAAAIREREKTGFRSFVYIMEDPRNNTFKLGRSTFHAGTHVTVRSSSNCFALCHTG
jgi:hypothetical protein